MLSFGGTVQLEGLPPYEVQTLQNRLKRVSADLTMLTIIGV